MRKEGGRSRVRNVFHHTVMGGGEETPTTSVQACFAGLSLSQVERFLLRERELGGRGTEELEYGDQRLTGYHLPLLLLEAECPWLSAGQEG